MTTIYTSFYTNIRNLNADYYRVSISRTSPRDCVVDEHLIMLAPQSSVLWSHKNGVINNEQYTALYTEYLDMYKEQIIEAMRQVWRNAHGRNIVLLCWEGKSKFCHRHLFADWFYRQTGYRIEEL